MKHTLLLLLSLVYASISQAQDITIDYSKTRQTIVANGINMEGYHVGQWDELNPQFADMLRALPCQVARIGAPMIEWESENDNDDSDVINWSGFNKEHIFITHSINRIRRMKQEFNVDVWLSFWNLPNWILKNPNPENALHPGRQINNIDEFAESICALLIYIKEQTGVEVKWVSFNESLQQDKEDGGWGGYNTVLSVEDNIRLLKKSAELFQKHGLKSRWIIGSLCFRPSELRQVKEILSDKQAQKEVDAVDFHSYELGYGGLDQLKAWGEFFSQSKIPTICGELDNYKSDFRGGDWIEHGMLTGKMYHQIYRYSYSIGSYPWFPGVPEERSTYRYADLHYFAHIPPSYKVVESESKISEVYVVGARKGRERVAILQNNSSAPHKVRISGFGQRKHLQVYESYLGHYGVRNDESVKFAGEELEIVLKPYSICSIGTSLAEIPELLTKEQ